MLLTYWQDIPRYVDDPLPEGFLLRVVLSQNAAELFKAEGSVFISIAFLQPVNVQIITHAALMGQANLCQEQHMTTHSIFNIRRKTNQNHSWFLDFIDD